MVRRIIQIDKKKCNGCGACAAACHEGAIVMVDGKATLLRDDYCDGLGDCLPTCEPGAITFVEREALEFDAAAVAAHMGVAKPFVCPGSRPQALHPIDMVEGEAQPSMLRQWPIQIKLVPTVAPYFDGADLLIAADCAAYAYASFHQHFIKDHITLIRCPKLDDMDYVHKLTEILAANDIRRVTLARMEVPCCGGLEDAMRRAVKNSGKLIPYHVAIISRTGELLS